MRVSYEKCQVFNEFWTIMLLIIRFLIFVSIYLLTCGADSGYIVLTSPPWVSTPGRKAMSSDVAFAFSRPSAPDEEVTQ